VFNAVNAYFTTARRTDIPLSMRIIGLQVIPRLLDDGSMAEYTLKQPGYPSETVQIRPKASAIHPATDLDMDINDLEVSANGQQLTFKDWVKVTFRSRQVLLYTVEDWWVTNELSFRFMDLPTELQCAVFEYIECECGDGNLGDKLAAWMLRFGSRVGVGVIL
jgi:hypothetical protein